MITTEEYAKLNDQLLEMERELKELGQVRVDTDQGPYALHEQALFDSHEGQRQYNELKYKVKDLRELIDAYDRVARFQLAFDADKDDQHG